jgi:hypothetical protein
MNQEIEIKHLEVSDEWGRRGTLIDYWWESQREGDH